MIKQLTRLPESLLLLAILTTPLWVSHSMLDLHFHDTYFVFSGDSWYGNLFYQLLNGMLFISWILLLVLRLKQLLAVCWRRIVIGLSLGFMFLIMIFERYPDWLHHRPAMYLDYEELSRLSFYPSPWLISLVCFILFQVFLWGWAVILMIKKRV